jgi:hypothetical protein
VFPVLPFVGPTIEGALVNLSAGGMALLLDTDARAARLVKGARLRVHFRLPGLPLTECKALITHARPDRASGWMRLGLRFISAPARLADRINKMVTDDETCDARVRDNGDTRCDLACSFHSLCHKPFRLLGVAGAQFEIALQSAA